MPPDLIDADPAWRSDDPHLGGNFAPVGRELDVPDLTVVAGRIPEDLSGVYMRNGPNPLFQPISYTYPFDGDGMVHAVYLDNGRARYRNRFVRTRALAVERRAGRAVYGGLMHPVPVDPALAGGDASPFKNGAFINVIGHGDHILALGEVAPAYVMTPELDTVGEWTAGTGRPIALGAHNRRHPATGDLFAIEYSSEAPMVTVRRIGAAGDLLSETPVALAAPSMIHDFVLTARHVVLLIGPAVFDLEAVRRGEPMLQWRPDLGTRIGLVPLDGGAPRWFETEAFFVFHFANGFERGGSVVIDYVRHDRLALGYGGGRAAPPTLHRLVLDRATGRIAEVPLADFVTEFPRIDARVETAASRFVYLPTLGGTPATGARPSGTFHALAKVDTESGATLRHDFGERIVGEPAFIPRPGAGGEGAGYLATYAYDPVAATSDLVLLDAADPSRDAVAVIRMPHRVPQGLHGNWIAGRPG